MSLQPGENLRKAERRPSEEMLKNLAENAKIKAMDDYRKQFLERYYNAYRTEKEANKAFEADVVKVGQEAYDRVIKGGIEQLNRPSKKKPIQIKRGITTEKLSRSNAKSYLSQLSDRQKKSIQQRLVDAGLLEGDNAVDGIIGQKTLDAYMKGESSFQDDFEAEELARADIETEMKKLSKSKVKRLRKLLSSEGYIERDGNKNFDGTVNDDMISAYMQRSSDRATQAISQQAMSQIPFLNNAAYSPQVYNSIPGYAPNDQYDINV